MRITRRIKKGLGFVFFAGMVCIISSAQELNFRGFPFGASPEDVVAKLGEPGNKYTNKEKRMLGDLNYVYKGVQVAGYSAVMDFEFDNNKLLGGSYNIILSGKPTNETLRDYVNAYNDLLDKLTVLYGSADINIKLERIGDVPITWLLGAEIEKNAPYKSIWDYGGGRVIQILEYENEKWTLSLVYFSPEVKGRIDLMEKDKKADSEGL